MFELPLTIDAGTMGRIISDDPGFNMPIRPYLAPSIMVLAYDGDAVIFEGANGTQVIRGRSCRALLSMLIPLCDGRHNIEQLSELVPRFSRSEVADAVALLYSRGLLQDGAPSLAVPHPLAAFIDRFIDVTRANRGRDDVVHRLTNSVIGIVASSGDYNSLSAELMASEIKRIEQFRAEAAGIYTLVIALESDESDISEPLAVAHAAGTMQLVVRNAQNRPHIGPLIMPGSSGCYQCWKAEVASVSDTDVGQHASFVPLIALAAFHLITRLATPLYPGTILEAFEPTAQRDSNRRIFAPSPSCSICGLGAEKQEMDRAAQFRVPWLYHCSVAMPPRELCSDRAYQEHFHPKNARLRAISSSPRFGSPRFQLLKPSNSLGPSHWGTVASSDYKALDVSSLAAVLWYSNGYQNVTASCGQSCLAAVG